MEKTSGNSDIYWPFSLGLPSPTTVGLVETYRCAARMGAEQQQLTIFYGGKVCVCEVTEEQARSILHFAQQENDSLNNRESSSPKEKRQPLAYHYQQGLCMKRSIRRFLLERKIRAMEASPYSRRP